MSTLATTPLTVHTPTETCDEKRREEAKMVRIKRVTEAGRQLPHDRTASATYRLLPSRQPRRHSCSVPSPAHRVLAPHRHAFHSTDANGTAKPMMCRP